MDLGLKDKVVLVTGASEGIGRAIAEAFAAEGSKIAITARRAEGVRKSAQEISQNTGAEVIGIVGDSSNANDNIHMVAGGSKQVEIYDSSIGRFLVASGQLNGPWHFMTETPLKDGRVLLAGGYANNDQATAQTWLYRP